MSAGRYNIKDILQFMATTFSGIGDFVKTDKPKTIEASVMNYVVVSLPVRIFDNIGYGMTTCRISLFARDNVTGQNMAALGTMQNAVYGKLPATNGTYSISDPTTVYGGVDGDFHVWHIQCDFII
jgi:hypothetical protein